MLVPYATLGRRRILVTPQALWRHDFCTHGELRRRRQLWLVGEHCLPHSLPDESTLFLPDSETF